MASVQKFTPSEVLQNVLEKPPKKYKTDFSTMKQGTKEDYINNQNYIKLTQPPSEKQETKKDDIDYDLLEKELNEEFDIIEKKINVVVKKKPIAYDSILLLYLRWGWRHFSPNTSCFLFCCS